MPAANRLFTFMGGTSGPWLVDRIAYVLGEPMPPVSRIAIASELSAQMPEVSEMPENTTWILRGITSNERYVIREEKTALMSKQEGLGRPESKCAALIPIRKTAAWWTLAQDERREIFEAQSQHIGVGMRHLPAIARRLHHCRDLSVNEPYDFLTWFEYAPSDTASFDELLSVMRASPEWAYVDREIDIRLIQAAD